MPVKTIFVDSNYEEFWVCEDGNLRLQECGDSRLVIPKEDLPAFSEWLAAEVAKLPKPETDTPSQPWDDYPVGEWIECRGDAECPVPGSWKILVKFLDGREVIKARSACEYAWWQTGAGWNITHFKIISKA